MVVSPQNDAPSIVPNHDTPREVEERGGGRGRGGLNRGRGGETLGVNVNGCEWVLYLEGGGVRFEAHTGR